MKNSCEPQNKITYALNVKILLDITPPYSIADRESMACFDVASDMIFNIIKTGAIGHKVIKYFTNVNSSELVIRIE